jgi:large subunit ribosomal protein L11
MDVKHIVSIYINSQMAESAPPLGTVLGNLGVNAVKFCKEFNEFTLELPNYFQLFVTIFIFENKNYRFQVELGSIAYFLSLLKFEKIENSGEDFIYLSQLVLLAKFTFPYFSLKTSLPILLGLLRSSSTILLNDLSEVEID